MEVTEHGIVTPSKPKQRKKELLAIFSMESERVIDVNLLSKRKAHESMVLTVFGIL